MIEWDIKLTLDVKYRPKAISSPFSSACLIALSREKPPAEIQSLPAQIARRKSSNLHQRRGRHDRICLERVVQ